MKLDEATKPATRFGYLVDLEPWLKTEVHQILVLTYAINATTEGDRVSNHLREIANIARRARSRLIDLKLDTPSS